MTANPTARSTVVTQDYHLRRALYSCVHAGIDAFDDAVAVGR